MRGVVRRGVGGGLWTDLEECDKWGLAVCEGVFGFVFFTWT